MATLFVTRGLPGSGKSTWARKLVASKPVGSIVRLNRDDIRRMAIDPEYRTPIHEAEQRVTLIQKGSAEAALRAGVDVVIDDTTLRLKTAREWADMAHKVGADFHVEDLSTPVEECIQRDWQRQGVERVGESIIRDMHRKFVAQHERNGVVTLPPVVASESPTLTAKPYQAVVGTPKAVMVDIDGTVADHEGVRSPYDPSRYHLDRPKQAVINVVHSLWLTGSEIVFCSGRDEDYRAETEAWLDKHVPVPRSGLFMRPSGDRRNDAIVKLQLFDAHIRQNFDVMCVLDDRDRVVEAWRSIGLLVLQVAPGDF